MSSPYIGEIRMVACNFAPVGWEMCEGQSMLIADNDALFMLLGTTYGGDGVTTFNLPDLRGRLPMHQGSGYPVGQAGGVEEVTLTVLQMPSHSHAPRADSQSGTSADPRGHVWANSAGAVAYSSDASGPAMASTAVQPAGSNLPHSNLQPYQCVNFIISLYGVFPSPT